ncbi:hypothetical protein GGX14DRAFT_402204 [Mycena pura]|uniref:Uncharacterized protein n=1 Tax=Mycena pura TaxID=153505 RepID=A0AAD6UYF5_9AGAR|nr:hypothetical protein GGX14DRAFT_402204 [Mycena pura]
MVREAGTGKQSELATDTGCTALLLDDCALGAFDLDAYRDRVILNARVKLTVNTLLEDMSFQHLVITPPLFTLFASTPALAAGPATPSALFALFIPVGTNLKPRNYCGEFT